MTKEEMAAAIALLAEARLGGGRIAALNATPASEAEGHAIQDQVAARLGDAIGGFKANAPPGQPAVRGAIHARDIFPSPARIPASSVPDLAVEGEIAFLLLRDFPAREAAYTREEVAQAAAVLPAIEVVSGRLADWRSRPALEQLADCLNNGALVPGSPLHDWAELDLKNLPVTASVNGETVWQGQGGHPIGDPLAVAVALVNLKRREDGTKAGQIVTTGSCTGIRRLQPGDRFSVAFAGLGEAELVFTPA